MPKIVRVAAAQLQPEYMNLMGSVAIAESAILEAGSNGALLIAFPEAWLPGFPVWVFAETGWRDARHMQAYAHLAANSVEVPGPVTDRLCEAARKAGVNVIIGINERDRSFSRETLYNSLLHISDEGKILGVRRKLKPTHGERVVWGEGDGSGIQVYDTTAGRIGGSICWEHWMPLNRFAMHALGEQIHVAAFPDMPEHNAVASRHYAFEGRCFVIAMGTIVRRDDIKMDFGLPPEMLISPGRTGDRDEFILAGGSGIIGPDGRWIVEQKYYDEEILYADLDLEDVTREKLSLDTVGHYNRPDVFQLYVDNRRRDPVHWSSPFQSGIDAKPAEQINDGE